MTIPVKRSMDREHFKLNLKAHRHAAFVTIAIIASLVLFMWLVVTFPLYMVAALLLYMFGFAIYFIYMIAYNTYKEEKK